MDCCGRPVRLKRFSFFGPGGLEVIKIGYCRNKNCQVLVLQRETVSLWGRLNVETYRGKQARRFLLENRENIEEYKGDLYIVSKNFRAVFFQEE